MSLVLPRLVLTYCCWCHKCTVEICIFIMLPAWDIRCMSSKLAFAGAPWGVEASEFDSGALWCGIPSPGTTELPPPGQNKTGQKKTNVSRRPRSFCLARGDVLFIHTFLLQICAPSSYLIRGGLYTTSYQIAGTLGAEASLPPVSFATKVGDDFAWALVHYAWRTLPSH